MAKETLIKLTTWTVLEKISISTLLNHGFNSTYSTLWFTDAEEEEPAPINRCWCYLESLNKNRKIWILGTPDETIKFTEE